MDPKRLAEAENDVAQVAIAQVQHKRSSSSAFQFYRNILLLFLSLCAAACSQKDVLALRREASAAYREQRYDDAIQLYSQALTFHPNNAGTLNNRGLAFQKKGQLDDAIGDFSRAIEIAPKYAIPYSNRAIAYAQMRRFQEAFQDFHHAVDFDPKDSASLNNFAWYLATCDDAKRRDPAKAIQLATKANELTSFELWNYLDTLAEAYASAGQWENAARWGRRSEELAPTEKKRALQDKLRRYDPLITATGMPDLKAKTSNAPLKPLP